jgi:large repetitive protein
VKTLYPYILSTVAGWMIRVLFVVLGMTLAVQLFSQENCTINISQQGGNPVVACEEPLPAFAPFEATNLCCDGPIEWTYFNSAGSQMTQQCAVSTAYGPGPDWSIWLPNLPGGLSQYWHFQDSPTWVAYNDGTAHLQGTIAMQGNSANQFIVDMWFHNGRNWNQWSALGRGYKDDLFLAETAHLDWMYYELATNFANLSGTGALSGSYLELTHQPSNLYYGFQAGMAANNRNANEGISGWFFYNGTVNGSEANGHGDLNVDGSCQSYEGCANTTHTRVARAEDACGHVAYASQTITVVDDLAPQVDPYEEIIQMDCENYAGVFITATDNCSEVIITYSDQSEGGCSTVTRTYTIMDGCGNTSIAVQTIILNAGEPPVFTVFPETLSIDCDMAEAIPTPEVLWSVGCGGEELTISSEIIEGNCLNSYSIVYTYIVTDNCGGADTALWFVQVQDVTPPQFFGVPADMDIFCGEEIPEVNVFALDNCDENVITSLSAETIYGTCGYDFVRTWTAIDACGNVQTASQTIHVNDVEKPNFSFVPASVMLECGTPFELAIPTAEDACSSVEMEWTDVDLEDCAGSYARIFRAFDGCGNSRLATVFVMFTDNEAPQMIEFPDDVYVTCSNLPSQGDVQVAWQDNCGNVTVEVSEQTIAGACAGAYTIARTWELMDDCGNTSAYTWNIHVSDTEAPTLFGVPEDMTIACGDEIIEALVVATDNCIESPEITLNAVTNYNECGYTFVRTWTAVDGCGNESSATQTITVEDDLAPEFTFVPQDINLACSTGEINEDELALAEDACSSVIVTFYDAIIEGNCGNGVLRTFVATDGCGNTATTDQIISYSDNFPPVFTFVSEDIQADCGDEVIIPMATAEDECGDVVVTYEDELLSACGGSFMRTYTALDGCGNEATASVNVVYNDGDVPVITSGPADLTVNCDEIPTIESAIIQFTDNCGNVSLNQNEVRVDGDCSGNYTLIRTYSLTDDCGNASEWIWTLTVVDPLAPEIFGVPQDATIGCGDVIPTADVFALDNCNEFPNLDLSAETIPTECGYLFVRTWTATDACGNQSTASQTITVTDEIDPFFTFVPANVNFTCGSAPEMEMATADDDCSSVEVTFVDEVINVTTGSFIRLWTATDGCGNTATEETVVTFNPDGPPAILCPGNQSLASNTSCQAIVPNYTEMVWVESACAEVASLAVTQSPVAGSIISEDAVISMTVTNGEGVSSTCQFTLNLIDEQAPVLSCLDDQFITLNANCTAVIPDYTDLIVSTDNCDQTSTYTQSPEPGTIISGTATLSIMITGTDAAGNSSQCSFMLTPLDVTAPFFTAFPNDVLTSCGANPGIETVDVQYVDACGATTISYEQSTEFNNTTCASSYVILHTWTIEDESGNTASATWSVNVEDLSIPELIGAPADITIACGDPIPDAQVIATDNCDDNVSVSLDAVTIPLDCGYIFQRIWTAVDDCGNTATHTQNITVEDDVDPYFDFVPAAQAIACDELATNYELLPQAIAGDDCSTVSVTFVDELMNDCGGSFTRVWTAIDGCGNTAQAETVYMVVDVEAPNFTSVPENFTVEGCDQLPEANIADVTYIENCSNVTISVVDEVFALDCPNNQIVYRVWRLTDACGNQSSYTQEIYIIDETGPEIFGVPANITLMCGETPAEANVYAVDNCSDAANINISLHAKTTQLSCGRIFVRVWTATDECGNSSIATQEITYIDNEPPVFAFVPADLVISCGQEYLLEDPIVSDDCSLFSVVQSQETFDCANSYTRMWIATDGCGNTAEASQMVVLEDSNPPVPNWVPADITVFNCLDMPVIGEDYVQFNDYCTDFEVVFYTDTNYFCTGSYNVLHGWLATDACGNSESISFNVTLLDELAPEFTVSPENLMLNCGDEIPNLVIETSDACGNAYLEYNDVIANLECGYQIQRTWYAFDDCGNLASHIQYITFEDNSDPIFVNVPEDLTFGCDEILPAPSMYFGLDDCDELIVANMINEEIVSGSCNNNYQILRTYQLQDECGHTSSHTQTINIQDITDPEFFNFQAQIELPCAQSNGVFATAFDACSSLSVNYMDDLIGTGCSGLIERTYTATDACGNSATAVQLISLVDETDPYFNVFPTDVTADCSSIPSAETAVVTFGDNCSNPSIVMSESIEEGSCANEYLLLRNYTLTDACGNTTTESWTITVQDMLAPDIFGVPAESYIECGDAMPSINPVAFDVCDEAPTLAMSAVTVPSPVGCGSLFIRTWVATDACGNEATTSHTTFINDTQDPILSALPADMFVPCSSPLPAAPIITALDLCDGEVDVTYEESSLIGNCPNVVREWCAQDCAGNQVCHTQTIYRSTSPILADGAQLVAINNSRHNVQLTMKASTAGRWNLDVFDLAGRKVTHLLAQDMSAGQQYQFDLDCQGFTDTIYMMRWSNGDEQVTTKVVMMK